MGIRLCLTVIFLLSPASAVPAFAQTVPANTPVLIRLDQSISSQNAKRNQRVKASVARDVIVNGDVLLPKGASAAVYVARVQPGGDSSKPPVLELRLDAIAVGGRAYPVFARYAGEGSAPMNSSGTASSTGAAETPVKATAADNRTASSAGVAAGTANAGTISPEGVPEVSYPSATVLSFRLTSPVHVK